jgi:acetyl-CoA C-acetyltransferase
MYPNILDKNVEYYKGNLGKKSQVSLKFQMFLQKSINLKLKDVRLFTSRPATDHVVAVSFARTPFGTWNGNLSHLPAPILGYLAIQAAVSKCNLKKELVEEAFIGNVLSSGLGQAPARQAVLNAGLPLDCPATTINKVCASGMKAIMIASMSISSGYRNVVVAGGMESMSNVPFYISEPRIGFRLGNKIMIDGLLFDGLTDAYSNLNMGLCAENIARKFDISRADQDLYAKMSYERAISAWNSGVMNFEVTPVKKHTKKVTYDMVRDDGIDSYNYDKMINLK